MEKKEKPLEKMTAKELREIALEIPEVEGVHAMKKEALLEAIRKSRGVEKEEEKEATEEKKEEEEAKEEKEEVKEEAKEEEAAAAAKKEEAEEEEEAKKEKEEAKKEKKKEKKEEKKAAAHVAGLKKRIREFKTLKAEAVEKGDARMAKIYKRRINRLKKRTRKAA
jgi:hypothetical protein